mmetsp:Transcript_25289/g.42672  ORF Transcript_25289/g.42672 Transcript_25289/m.42672 type:complete len:187 (-) Transcript_25289:400-960(-)
MQVTEKNEVVEPARVCVVTIPLDQQLQHHRELIQKALRATLALYLLVILNILIQLARAISRPIYVLIPLVQLFCSFVLWWFARSAIKWNQKCCCGMTNLGTYEFILWVFLLLSIIDFASNLVLFIMKGFVISLVAMFVSLLFIFVECVNLHHVRQLVVDYSTLRTAHPTIDLEGGEGVAVVEVTQQ